MSSPDFSNISFDLPKNQSNVIKVIGVGGGGSNAVNHMYSQGINGVDFVICNTDAQALQNSPVPTKIQLGVTLTEGLGAGANPDVGAEAAEESIDQIREMLATNSKMVFINVGMGGGTGTGAAPIIARVARELDLLTIGIVTIPFSFEGKMRNDQAQKGIEKLRQYVDSLVIINNNKLREVYGNLGFKAGFSKADEVLSTASRGIAEVITHHYTQNIDLRDAKTVLANSGTAIMGSATAIGTNRSEEAISKALDSPLLNDNKIIGAKNVLLLIVSGTQEITIDEIGEINDYIQSEAKSNVNIIMGVGEDESLGEAISVTIVATGFNKDQQQEISNLEPSKVIHVLGDEQETSFDLSEEKVLKSTVKHSLLMNEEVAEEKIVYNLGEEIKEDNFEFISATEFIKNIEVVYEEITITKPSDFVITDVTPQVEAIVEEEIKEEQQISFTFDMPLASKPLVEKSEEKAKIEIRNLDVYDHKEIPSTPKVKEEEVYFSLEDYTELEENLTKAVKPLSNISIESEEELKITVKSLKTIDINEQEVIDHKEVSPLDLTISELQKRSAERREKMKHFNYKFINKLKSNIDEIEREPAYKRMGVKLDNTAHSSEIKTSRTTLEIDENDDIQFRSNNSFLHDNVD
jgi:cell division protein FtsZ